MGLAAIVALALSWSAFTTLYYLNFDFVLRQKERELAQARKGERQLLKELQAFNGRLRDLSETIAFNRAELTRVAGRSEDLPGSAAGENGAPGAHAVNAAIQLRMRALSDSWQDLNLKSAQLEVELTGLGRDLEGTIVEHERLGRERDMLLAQVRELRDQVAMMRAANLKLLADAEQGKSARRERDQLVARLRTLEEESNTLRGTNAKLNEHASERIALRRERDALATRVRGLEEDIATIRTAQDRFVDNLFDKSKKGVAELERVVAATGVDIDRMLTPAGRREGRGGPLVPAKIFENAPLNERANDLRRKIDRWQSLHAAVRNLPLTAPVESSRLTSVFGGRRDPFTGRWAVHNGVDMAGSSGTPVLATGPGSVVFTGWHGGYGWMVEIDHGVGVRTRYAHLQSIAVQKGEKITAQEKVGLMGCSGRCTGPHLHYEVLIDGKAVDPVNFLSAGEYVSKR
jgi:murein DD-endopeptidase MepM/ murein hydrolase activator NlpD